MGFVRGSSLSYAANAVGTRSAYDAVSTATRSFRTSGGAHAVAFSADDRTAQARAGAAHA